MAWTTINIQQLYRSGIGDGPHALLVLEKADGTGVIAQAGAANGLAVEGIAGGEPLPISGTVSVDTSALATSAKQDTGNTSLASILAKIIAAPSTEAKQDTAIARTGTIRHTTTPSKADAATGPVEVDARGNTRAALACGHQRILQLEVEGATTIVGSGTLSEGPCDGISCETADVYVFAQLREGQDFVAPAASWTAGAGWALKAGSTTVYEHTAGNVATLSLAAQAISSTVQPMLQDVPFAVKFNVASRSAGDVTLAIGNASGSARSTDGNYIECVKSTSGAAITFTPHTDFDGEIDISQIRIGMPINVAAGGVPVPVEATRILGVALKSAPATLVASPLTAVVRAWWYRRAGAVETT